MRKSLFLFIFEDWKSRCGLVIRCRNRKTPGSKLDSTADLSCNGPVARYITRREPNVLPLVWCGSLERGIVVQGPSSSSDRDSKFRGPSPNSTRVA
ncbi:hypothetical protein AVEN_242689-1 [Araneus ventricosus]|uniref:Uncharacterized protein n=1 Tax=Araneus ventricosus TaxID=182803 RepID=A0A4Y2E1V6_ARAVE|nr:hypothetical protein AVEN_242689-1 [Araneus ventricosus]